MNLMKLEKRIVLDGAGFGEAVDHDADHQEALSNATVHTDNTDGQVHDASDHDLFTAAATLLKQPEVDTGSLDIILISSKIDSYQDLADAAAPGAYVIVYDAQAESIQDVVGDVLQLSQTVNREIDSLTILSHGGTGYFQLGNGNVNETALANDAATWQNLGAEMSQDARIYVYGCNVASDSGDGQSFVDKLANLTQADVYASDDITGKGGDWDLEAASNGADDVDTVPPPLKVDILADFDDQLQIKKPAFLASGQQFGREDALNSFVVVVFTDENANTDNYWINPMPEDPNSTILSNIKLDLDVGVVEYKPEPDETQTPPGYVGWRFTFTYTADVNAYHTNDNGENIIIEVYDSTDRDATYVTTTYNLRIISQNDAPEIGQVQFSDTNGYQWGLDDRELMMSEVMEDDTGNQGNTVEEIINSAGADYFTDREGDTIGLAIMGADNTDDSSGTRAPVVIGEWQYSIDGGNTWTAFTGQESDTSATLLGPNDRIRFVPAENYYGSTSGKLTFKAWDVNHASTGNSGDTNVDTTLQIGATKFPANMSAFSEHFETVTMTVTRQPDPPEIQGSGDDLMYTENDPATVIDPNLAVTDPDDPQGDTEILSGAVIRISNNFQNDAATRDVLSFTDTDKIKGTWDQNTGTLTLTGDATVNEYQAALKTIRFSHAGEDPHEQTRAVTFTVTGQDGLASNAFTRDIQVMAVNDAPVLAPEQRTLVFPEGSNPLTIADSITVTDVDDNSMTQAIIQITGNYRQGEDLLSFSNTQNITGNWDAQAGTLTLTGTASKAEYQTALQTITYQNSSEDPDTANRTITLTIRDANSDGIADGFETGTATRTISVTAENDAPVINPTTGDMDYVENQPAASIDPNLTLTDVDSDNINGATVRITDNYTRYADPDSDGQIGDALIFTNTANITGQWDAATATLTLTGTASKADYQAALQNIQYVHYGDDPGEAARTVTLQVTDDTGVQSAIATRTINVDALNDSPDLNPDSGVLNYEEGDGAKVIDTGISIADLDDENMVQATIQITGNYQAGEDMLNFTPTANISGNWNQTTGTLTLTGPATIAEFQTALQSVTYSNSSDTPDESVRTVTYTITDANSRGFGDGPNAESTDDSVVRTINVQAMNLYPHPEPMKPPIPPGRDDLGVPRPPGDIFPGGELGAIPLPGQPMPTPGGMRFFSFDADARRSFAVSGKEIPEPFCSLEETLRLGCRFANTENPDARFSSVTWESTEWTKRPDLDEESDLYSRLFIREAGDPGFNDAPGKFNETFEKYTGNDDPSFLRNPGHPMTDRPFSDTPSTEDFNDMGPTNIYQDSNIQRKSDDKDRLDGKLAESKDLKSDDDVS